jgi:NADPH2:quinone reductase
MIPKEQTMRAVQVLEFNNRDKVEVSEVPVATPAVGEVVIEVKAAPVNYVDLVTMRGEYQFKPPLPYTPGKGPVGVVVDVGADVDRVGVGDRVLAMAEYGGFADFCLAPAVQTYRLPDGLDFFDAAGLSLAYDTAWMALVERARLKAGERVLVLGATGAVGAAAVQLARALGAGQVIAGTSSSQRFAEMQELGADDYVEVTGDRLRDTLRDRVLEVSDGHGADVVVDMLGGDVFDGAVRAVAWRGRLVIVGFAAGRITNLKMNYPLLKNIEVSGLQISDYRKRLPELLDECYAQVLGLAEQGVLKSRPVSAYPLVEWHQALAAVESRRVPGRVLLVP